MDRGTLEHGDEEAVNTGRVLAGDEQDPQSIDPGTALDRSVADALLVRKTETPEPCTTPVGILEAITAPAPRAIAGGSDQSLGERRPSRFHR